MKEDVFIFMAPFIGVLLEYKETLRVKLSSSLRNVSGIVWKELLHYPPLLTNEITFIMTFFNAGTQNAHEIILLAKPTFTATIALGVYFPFFGAA